MNGQQRAEKNHLSFLCWAESKTDAEFREMAIRGQLSRKEIASECGFAKSVIGQNPRVREALKTLEDTLRGRGVLPPAADNSDRAPPTPLNPNATVDKVRVKRRASS